MINLCLVVIATQFSETKKREMERMLQERKRFHSSSTLASIGEPGSCYKELIKYVEHVVRKSARKLRRFWRIHVRSMRKRRMRRTSNPHTTEQMSLQRRQGRHRRRQGRHRRQNDSGQQQQQQQMRSLSSDSPRSRCASPPQPPAATERHCSLASGTESPRAPRASPEASDIDLHSSVENTVNCLVSGRSLRFRELLSPHDMSFGGSSPGGVLRLSSLTSLKPNQRRTSSPSRRTRRRSGSRTDSTQRLAELESNAVVTKCLSEAGIGRTEVDFSIYPSSSQPVCDILNFWMGSSPNPLAKG